MAHAVRGRVSVDVEELLGGRVLAFVGGIATLVGLAFFVALAIDQGWIGIEARVATAFGGSALFAAAGIYLVERRSHGQAALAATGTGHAGVFLSVVAATLVYDLLPIVVALTAVLAVGASCVVLAIRWSSPALAGLGVLGSLLAPVSVGAGLSPASVAYLAVALAAAAAVLVWRRWEWLRILAFLAVMPQAAAWAYFDSPGARALALGLGGLSALNLVAALGFELRVPPRSLRPSTSLLVAVNGLVAAGVGGVVLYAESGARSAGLWVAGVALTHVALGLVAVGHGRIATEIGAVLLGAGLVSANVAFALLADGPVLAIVWAASAAALGAATRMVAGREDLLQVALGGQLALAAAHTLLVDAPLASIAGGPSEPLGAFAATAAVAIGALACARLTRSEGPLLRRALDTISVAGFAYLAGLVFDGAALVVAWAAAAAALTELGRRSGDRAAHGGALGLVGLGVIHVLGFEAPPGALVDGVGDLGASALALATLVAVLAHARHSRPPEDTRARGVLLAASALGGLYLASVGIVDAFQPDHHALDTGLQMDVRQQGQAALSAFWSLIGLAALWAGLRRSWRHLRLAGFGVLLLGAGKVFLYDLSALGSTWRVLSFIVLGMLLLTAAAVYQRARRDVRGRGGVTRPGRGLPGSASR